MSAADDARKSNEYVGRSVDYSPEGIESIRGALGEYRQRAMDNWPEGIEMTVVLTHAIALLARFKELEMAGQEDAKARKAAKHA